MRLVCMSKDDERRESFRHQDEIGLGANFNGTVLLRISWKHGERLASWPKCQVRAAEGPNILTSGMDQDGRPIMSGLGRAFGSDIWIHQLVFMMSGPSKHQQIQQFVCEHVPFRLWHCWSGQHHWNWQIWHMARHLGVLDLPFWGTTKNLVCSQCVGADIYKGEMGTSRSLGMFPSLPLQRSTPTHCDSSLKPRAKHVMVWISVDVGGFSESGTAQNRVIAERVSRRQWKCVRPSCINKRDRSWHLHMKLRVESGSLEAGHLVQKCNWIDGKEGRNLTGFQTVPRLL